MKSVIIPYIEKREWHFKFSIKVLPEDISVCCEAMLSNPEAVVSL